MADQLAQNSPSPSSKKSNVVAFRRSKRSERLKGQAMPYHFEQTNYSGNVEEDFSDATPVNEESSDGTEIGDEDGDSSDDIRSFKTCHTSSHFYS